MRTTQLLLAVLTVTAWLRSPPAEATTYIVKPDGSGDFPTIQAAINVVVSDDVVLLTDGTFTGPGNRDVDFGGKAIVLQSQSGNPQAFIIDCQGTESDPHRGFVLDEGEGPGTRIEGIAVRNGLNYGGGAILCTNGSSPTFGNCRFESNRTPMDRGAGGAVCGQNVSLTFTACVFASNESDHGGGAIYAYQGQLSTDNCLFTGNRGGIESHYQTLIDISQTTFEENHNEGGIGGAFFAYSDTPGASLHFTDCVFRRNTAYMVGAAAIRYWGEFTVERCRFEENSAFPERGAVEIVGSTGSLTDCTFLGNTADSQGGATYFQGGAVSLSRCTFRGNGASDAGCICSRDNASISLDHVILAYSSEGAAATCAYGGTVTLVCCDVYGNTGGDYVDCIAGQQGLNGNILLDPLFCDAPQGNLKLHSDSPCAAENNPICGQIGAWPSSCGSSTGVDNHEIVARDLIITGVEPNPFEIRTRIRYAVPGLETIRPTLAIYDSGGRRVRSLLEGEQEAGTRTIWWDGRDDRGATVASGIYFCRLLWQGRSRAQRVLFFR